MTCLSGAKGGPKSPGRGVQDCGEISPNENKRHSPEGSLETGLSGGASSCHSHLPRQAQQRAQPQLWGVGRLGHRSEKLLVPVGTLPRLSG